MKRKILVLLCLACLFAGFADAQTRPTRRNVKPVRANRWDFSLQTRYQTSRDFSAEQGSSLELQDSLGWGFGFGYNFNQRFNLGMVFSWRSVNYNATAIDGDDPDNTHRYSGSMSISTIAITGDWNLLQGPITPYLNGNLGWMLVDTNIFAGYNGGCWWDPWWGYVCGNYPTTYGVNATVASLGAGMRFDLSPSVFARVGYERGWTDIDRTSGTNMVRIDIGLMN